MRASLLAVVASLMLVNVSAADDRQWYVDAFARYRMGITETETYLLDFTSDKNFPADISLGKTGDIYRDIELLESQMETLLIYNGKLTTYLNVLHIRVISLNSLLADRQRDLRIKGNDADGPYRPLFQNLQSLNEVTKAGWHARRALLVTELQLIDQISQNLVQLRHVAHGYKEQLLAGEPFPDHLDLIKRDAIEKITAGAMEINNGLAQLKVLARPRVQVAPPVVPTPPGTAIPITPTQPAPQPPAKT